MGFQAPSSDRIGSRKSTKRSTLEVSERASENGYKYGHILVVPLGIRFRTSSEGMTGPSKPSPNTF